MHIRRPGVPWQLRNQIFAMENLDITQFTGETAEYKESQSILIKMVVAALLLLLKGNAIIAISFKEVKFRAGLQIFK